MDTINCIILDIFEFLEILDIQSYLYTHVIRRDHIKYFYQKKKKWINTNISPLVQQIFPKSLINYPFIVFKEIFLDKINYIRNIFPNDFKTSIVIGKDNYNRPFIVVKYQENILNSSYQLLHSHTKNLVLFKHFHGDWSSCSPFENCLYSKDKYRCYLVFDKTSTSITYKRLMQMYRKEKISIYQNNLQYIYCIENEE
jgi:hypothetical protein